MKHVFTLFLSSLILIGACSDHTYIVPTSPSGVVTTGGGNNPVPPVPPVITSRIEFRVTGNALGARVRLSDSVNGLSQVTTTLPYSSIISTTADSLFVSLEATPTTYSVLTDFPFMSVQIFSNGNLFRESTSNSFLLETISVSGTWHR